MPKLCLTPCYAVHPKVLSIEDREGDRPPWLVAVVTVLVVPCLACLIMISLKPCSGTEILSRSPLPLNLPPPKPLKVTFSPPKNHAVDRLA